MSRAKILMVSYQGLLGEFIDEILSAYEYEVQRHVVNSEGSYQKKVIEQVRIVEPDLLVVILAEYPDKGQIADWTYFGSLHSVEVLREHSNTPVLYVIGGELSDFSPEQWERIALTHPVGVLSMPFDVEAVETTVQSALELAAVEKRYGTTKKDLENRLIKRTEYLLRTGHSLVRQAYKRSGAERSATAYNLRLQAVLDCSIDPMFIKDNSLKYVMVNPAMAEFMNKPASELIGKTDEELYDQETANHFRNLESRALQGDPIEEEYSRPIHGEKAIFLESRIPLRDSYSNIIGLWGILKNISERRAGSYSEPRIDYKYRSRAMTECLKSGCQVAMSDTPVLLLGESGSGKDYLARYIHDHSHRCNGPFFDKNCAAIGETMAESELFGHERGAFTGAHARKRGIIEIAEGGTLLLNEIGELSQPLQAKLLSFLDTGEFERLGGNQKIRANARIIFATNRNLPEEVKQGNFRKDLFYRINRFSIVVPPLRDRPEDIPILVQELLERVAGQIGLAFVPKVDSLMMKTLASYSWPGNVRELRNVLERALILSKGGAITPGLLEYLNEKAGIEGTEENDSGTSRSTKEKISQALRSVEESEIDLAREAFYDLPDLQQGYHLDIMVNQVCGGKPGAVKYVCDLMEMSDKTLKERIKLVGVRGKIATGNPGRGARERMVPKLRAYLLNDILKPTR